MPEKRFTIGTRVKVRLDAAYWSNPGWHAGTVVRIQPYSHHRDFYWVDLDEPAVPRVGPETRLISVLNPRNLDFLGTV